MRAIRYVVPGGSRDNRVRHDVVVPRPKFRFRTGTVIVITLLKRSTVNAAFALLALSGSTVAMLAAGTSPAMAQSNAEEAGEVDLETFYRELSPYGDWFEHAKYGTVWRPHVADGWRPYTRGHWAHTEDHGWYWVAEEEWGWAPFHYGRWAYDDREDEWLWIPGTEWAPAWVMWRESDEYIGWAPLPPEAVWEGDSGLRFSSSFYDGPRFSNYWSFVSPRYMFEPGLWRHFVPRSRHATLWRDTRFVNNHHRFERGRIFHYGIDPRKVERLAGRSVPVVTLRSVANPRAQGWRNINDPRVVPVYRPRFVARPDRTPSVFGRPDFNRDRGMPQPGNGGFWGGRGPDRSRQQPAAPQAFPQPPSNQPGGFGGQRGFDGRSSPSNPPTGQPPYAGDRGRFGGGRPQGAPTPSAAPTPSPAAAPTPPTGRPQFTPPNAGGGQPPSLRRQDGGGGGGGGGAGRPPDGRPQGIPSGGPPQGGPSGKPQGQPGGRPPCLPGQAPGPTCR